MKTTESRVELTRQDVCVSVFVFVAGQISADELLRTTVLSAQQPLNNTDTHRQTRGHTGRHTDNKTGQHALIVPQA